MSLHSHLQTGLFRPLYCTGSDKKDVMGAGSIPMAIHPSCHGMHYYPVHVHTNRFSRVAKLYIIIVT